MTTSTMSMAPSWQGWLLGVAVAALVNIAVPVALSHLSRPTPTIEPPMPSRRVTQVPVPPPPLVPVPVASEPAAALATPVAQVPLPALELPSLPNETAAITVPAISTTQAWNALPLVMPSVTVAGPLTDGGVPPATSDTALGFDQPPQRLTDLDLARFYPRTARLRGTTGQSVLRLSIATDGSVSAATVVRSTPAGLFDRAAEELGMAQRFLPARLGERTVPALITMTINWTLER